MKKHISMPSIKQFRQIIKDVIHTARFKGYDEDNEPIFDNNIELPKLTAKGTTKLHGTCASCCYNNISGIWFQSKNNIITPQKDNAGFAAFGEGYKDYFMEIIDEIKNEFNINTSNNTIGIFGEFAGEGIQKNVAISNIVKSFFIFGIKITPFNEEIPAYWLDGDFEMVKYDRIFKIWNFKTFEVEIDFNNPLLSQNKMVDMVTEVENECPVASEFGIKGIGEGIVFVINYKGQRFSWKSKGDKHAGKSKVKKAKKVDDKKLQLINDIVEQVTPEWRLSQAYVETFDIINGGQGDIKGMGNYIRAVINDIIKEDLDIINDAGLVPKDINKKVSDVARKWLLIKLDEEAGLK